MLRVILTLLFMFSVLDASYLETKRWKKGESFLSFLEDNKIPLAVYYDLDSEDRELAMEIQSGIDYDVLLDDDGNIEQVLIPVGEELQLHLIKDKQSRKFSMITTPVSYKKEDLVAVIEIRNSPYQDIIKHTNNYALANEFSNVYRKSVDFKNLRIGDKLVIFYSQKKRLGKRYGQISIDAAMIEIRGEQNFVFLYEDDRYLTDKAKELRNYAFELPIRSFKRISSKFTNKRWHPILKRYRAHLGIDYAANSGTIVRASGKGKVTFVGRKGGYGKTIEIVHEGGYKTLYAHLKGYKNGIKRGKRVSKGQIIGYVGNTGLSTGPHLHFGLYKNNRAINPNSIVRVVKTALSGDKKKKYLAYVKEYKNKFKEAIDKKEEPLREKSFSNVVSLEKETKT